MELRLAYNPGPINTYRALEQGGSLNSDSIKTISEPTVRLAYGNSPPKKIGSSGLESPTVYLATPLKSQTGANSADHLAQQIPSEREISLRLALGGVHSQDKQMAMVDRATVDRATAPALLVSYVYLEPFLKNRYRYHYRDWALDSGAFSAHQSGTEINLQSYIDTCKQLIETDPTLTEVFALDVIGDHKASLVNCEEMWKQGVEAIPCYHVGEPEDVLLSLARDYPKIALGGAVGYKGKDRWAEQCFARIWPKRIHGFGFGSEKSIMLLPWHSIDATNWEIGPCRYGRWATFGKMSVRGSKQNLRSEVEFYLKLEEKARFKWRKQMQELNDTLSGCLAPTVRLAEANPVSINRRIDALR